MMIRSLFSLLLLTLLCTCAPSPKEADTAEAPPAAPAATVTYPSIDFDRLAYLYTNATYMDATFYTLPISINQSELVQIQQTLGGIAEEPVQLAPGCQPTGHIWFQVNGKNIEEADLYFSPGCIGYVWYENGKPAYSNMMTENGISFYNNIINSLKQQTGN